MSDAEKILDALATSANFSVEVTESLMDVLTNGIRCMNGASKGNLPMALSGAFGFFAGSLKMGEKLLTAGDVIRTRLTPEQKGRLVRRIMTAAERFDVDDPNTLLPLLGVDSQIQRTLFRELEDFLNENGYQ